MVSFQTFTVHRSKSRPAQSVQVLKRYALQCGTIRTETKFNEIHNQSLSHLLLSTSLNVYCCTTTLFITIHLVNGVIQNGLARFRIRCVLHYCSSINVIKTGNVLM